jgi:hypothetical protein
MSSRIGRVPLSLINNSGRLHPGKGRQGFPTTSDFESFDWPTAAKVRTALEGIGLGYGTEGEQPGRFYQYPGDPIARGVGTPVSHTTPM